MAHIDLAPITQWITETAVRQGDRLPELLMERLVVNRRRATQVLHKLVGIQWLVCEGSPRRPCYRPGLLRQVVRRYPLQDLQEDLPWRRDFAPFFELSTEVRRMAQHAFSELLSNAVDHSAGTHVAVSMRQTPVQVQLLVSDDGCGLFDRIARSFAIDDPQVAMLEISKGKLTSQPENHSGYGLYFTSRVADVFDLHANQAAFQCRSWERLPWRAGRPAARSGTSIYVAIALDTPRTLDAVLRAHSLDQAGYAFDRTVVPLHLLGGHDVALASRADAKRVAARLPLFRRAEIDFEGIADIGHGFADELFRVFRREHPEVELVPLSMAPRVAAMVQSVAS
jgi:anti-sigma regulatory factor (Ser/Thr protein kinase)